MKQTLYKQRNIIILLPNSLEWNGRIHFLMGSSLQYIWRLPTITEFIVPMGFNKTDKAYGLISLQCE